MAIFHENDTSCPEVVIEAKAMAIFDVISEVNPEKFAGWIQEDITKASAAASKAAQPEHRSDIFVMLILTHAYSVVGPRLHNVVKYRATRASQRPLDRGPKCGDLNEVVEMTGLEGRVLTVIGDRQQLGGLRGQAVIGP
jgi:hypothetical protein